LLFHDFPIPLKFGAKAAERYDLDLKAGGHNGEVDRRVSGRSLATVKPDRNSIGARLNPSLPWPFTPFPYRTGENIACLLDVIKSSASPRGSVVTCVPVLELGEMAASKIELRRSPVRVRVLFALASKNVFATIQRRIEDSHFVRTKNRNRFVS
jgi:hypothetical protein